MKHCWPSLCCQPFRQPPTLSLLMTRTFLYNYFVFAPLVPLCCCYHVLILSHIPLAQIIDKYIHALCLSAAACHCHFRLLVSLISLNKATCWSWFLVYNRAELCNHHSCKTVHGFLDVLSLSPATHSLTSDCHLHDENIQLMYRNVVKVMTFKTLTAFLTRCLCNIMYYSLKSLHTIYITAYYELTV